MRSRPKSDWEDLMGFFRSAGTRLDFPQNSMLSKQARVRPLQRKKILKNLNSNCNRSDSVLIGPAKWTPRIQSIINGRSGFFCNYSSRALHIKRKWLSTGVRKIKSALQMKK